MKEVFTQEVSLFYRITIYKGLVAKSYIETARTNGDEEALQNWLHLASLLTYAKKTVRNVLIGLGAEEIDSTPIKGKVAMYDGDIGEPTEVVFSSPKDVLRVFWEDCQYSMRRCEWYLQNITDEELLISVQSAMDAFRLATGCTAGVIPSIYTDKTAEDGIFCKKMVTSSDGTFGLYCGDTNLVEINEWQLQ